MFNINLNTVFAFRTSFIRVFFVMMLLIGLIIFRDYGISFDEPVSRDNGGISLRYVLERLYSSLIQSDQILKEITTPLDSYRDRDYGVAFDMPVFAIERLLLLNDSSEQFYLRHLLTFFVFWLSSIAFYQIAELRYPKSNFALLGAFFYFVSPRIFAESFYNNKDIVFMSLGVICTLTLLRFLNNPSLQNIAFHALASALTIDVRITGIIFPALTIVFFMLVSKVHAMPCRSLVQKAAIYFSLTVILTIIFWPWLWDAPFAKLKMAFLNMSNFRWPNFNLYMGQYISAQKLPWHYPIVWIVTTTPPLYLLLASVGIFRVMEQFCKLGSSVFTSFRSAIDYVAFSILFGSLAAVILLESTLYDGWRQLYFVYPALLILSLTGVASIAAVLSKLGPFWIRCFQFGLVITVSMTAIWMIKAHPYQNVYFNLLAPRQWSSYFDGDYWGLSNLAGLKFIAAHDNQNPIRVAALGANSIAQSLMLMPAETRNRFEFVASEEDARYLITNFRYLVPSERIAPKEHWKKIYSITIDGNDILNVFIKH